MKLKIILLLCAGLSFGSVGCKKSDTAAADTAVAETAQQIGDAMASVDEAGGSSGTIASMQGGVQKTFERLAPNDIDQKQSLVAKLFLPQAEAVACDGYGFGTCAGGVITRNFNSCTIGAATFTGTVALTWSNGSACSLAAPPEFITRIPDITVTGRRGATLKITKSGSFGQKMT